MYGMCEVCGEVADGEFKSACLKVRLCIQHARDWDDVVCDMPEWRSWWLADAEYKTVLTVIRSGSVPLPHAVIDVLGTLKRCDEVQRLLRPRLKELFKQMKADYKPKESS